MIEKLKNKLKTMSFFNSILLFCTILVMESSTAMEVNEERSEEYSEESSDDEEMVILRNSIVELKLPKSELYLNNISTISDITKDIFQNYYFYGTNTKNKPILAIFNKGKMRQILEWPVNYWKIYAHEEKSFTLWSIRMNSTPTESPIDGDLMDMVTRILPLLMHMEKDKDGNALLYGSNSKGYWGVVCIAKSALSAFEDELEDILFFDKRI